MIRHADRVVVVRVVDDIFNEALAEALHLPEPVSIAGLDRNASIRGWDIVLSSPTFDPVEESREAPPAQLTFVTGKRQIIETIIDTI